MDNQKIWCGSGKEKFDGDLISLNICLSDIPKEHINTGSNGKKYIRLNAGKKRNGVDDYGNSHGVSVDTWKPDPNNQPQQNNQQQTQKFVVSQEKLQEDDLRDLPF